MRERIIMADKLEEIENTFTVSDYLKLRLEEIGLEQMYGVAGNYTAAFLDTILADKDTPIKISGNSNEICAGFAADAYARVKGVSALYVTYSVGAFTLLNTIAGSFVEQVPVILINGAPTNKEDAIEKMQDFCILIRPVTSLLISICSVRLQRQQNVLLMLVKLYIK